MMIFLHGTPYIIDKRPSVHPILFLSNGEPQKKKIVVTKHYPHGETPPPKKLILLFKN
jgi:hypothetical protein